MAGRREGRIAIGAAGGRLAAQFGKIAERHPGLKMIVDHMGALRGAKGDAAFPRMHELTALARLPNVADGAYPGTYPFVGSPDDVAEDMARMCAAGFAGASIAFFDYLKEIPFLIEEVLPRLERLGVRAPSAP